LGHRDLVLPLVGGAGCLDVVERRTDYISGHSDTVIIIEVEALVEGVVQLAPDLIVSALVEAGHVPDQADGGAETLGADLQLGTGVGKAGLHALPFELDGVTALVDLVA
jgi:hypothetical protein